MRWMEKMWTFLKKNDQVKKKSASLVVQGCSNYEILGEEQEVMHILDHEAALEGQRSIKSRNYRSAE